MPKVVEIDDRNLRKSMRNMEAFLRRPATVYGRAARHMRDYVRQTITMQGRKRLYVPLSQWTRDRTGRRKALIHLRPFIKAKWDNIKGEVYFEQKSSGWHIDQHHTGYTSPAVLNKRMVVPRHGGGIFAVFSNRKASKTPAREVWPNQAELTKEMVPIFKTWVDDIARRQWR